jgi:hypothetical protein
MDTNATSTVSEIAPIMKAWVMDIETTRSIGEKRGNSPRQSHRDQELADEGGFISGITRRRTSTLA